MKYMFLLIIHGLIVLSSTLALADELEGASTSPSTSTAESKPAPQSLKNGSTIASLAGSLKSEMGTYASAAAKDFEYLAKYQATQDGCADKESTTTYTCLEKSSPDIAKALPMIQAAIAAMGAGAKDSCSSFSKAMDLANTALLAYQGACAASKALCQSSCGGAADTLKKSQDSITKAAQKAATQYSSTGNADVANEVMRTLTSLNDEIKKDLNKEEKLSVAGKNSTCSGYSSQLASALTGGMGVLNSMGQANKCDTATNALPVGATPVDCTIAANSANNMTCICQRAPRTAGCTNGLDTNLSTSGAGTVGSADTGSYTPTATGAGTGIDGMTDLGINPGAAGASSGGAGAPISGGAGVDGGSGAGGTGTQAAQKAGSSLNTNILSGEGGGGGSGGGSFGSNGGSDGNGLRQYLPGGKRDPAAALGAGKMPADVTSEGGRSNWEKVTDRYRDNNTTLLGN